VKLKYLSALCLVSVSMTFAAGARPSPKTKARRPASKAEVKKAVSKKSDAKKASISYESYLQANSSNAGLLAMRKLPQEAFKEAPRRATVPTEDPKIPQASGTPAGVTVPPPAAAPVPSDPFAPPQAPAANPAAPSPTGN
jgi:hypothetical protein